LARHAEARTLTVSENGQTLGLGVVIDPRGFAITPGEVAFDEEGQPRTSLKADTLDRRLPIAVIGFDPSTDLALVSLPAGESYPAASLAQNISQNVVMVMLPGGPVRGQVAANGMDGVMALTGRYMPLNEIRLDSGGRAPTGAPVFLPDGTLAGIISAELNGPRQISEELSIPAGSRTMTGFAAKLGPIAPATAFSLDLPVLQRVIEGYKSANRIIEHPWVGLFFKTSESPNQGAEITKVIDNSPGQLAGIRIGDVVVGSPTRSFRTHVVFGSLLFRTSPGDRLDVSIVREGSIKQVSIQVAREPNSTSRLERKKIG
jgi:S1-C subfamily serine protease